MSVRPSTSAQPALATAEGELVLVRVTIEPRLLEETLDALAHVHFPINPEILHGWPTVVEFPAYRSRLGDVRRALERHGIGAAAVQVSRMLDAILS